MRHTTTFCLTLLALLLVPACGSSDGGTTNTGPEVLTFTFTRVVATGDVTSVGTFETHGSSSDPGIGATGAVASEATVDGVRGFLIFDGTNFHFHAAAGTSKPGGGTWGSTVENGVINNGFTSFEDGGGSSGIYIVPTDGSSPVAEIVGTSTVVTDTSGTPLMGDPTFTNIGEHGRSGALTVFVGTRNDGSDVQGLYMDNGGTLSLIFEAGDAHPLLGGTVEFVSEPHARDGDWSARVSTTTQSGIVANLGGTQILVASESDATPSGLGLFERFDESSISGNRVVFQGRAASTDDNGVYLYDHNTMTLTTVADSTVTVPGSTENFETASDPSIAGDYVVFVSAAPVDGVYLYNIRDGSIYRVLADGDTLDGKTVDTHNKRDAYTIAGNHIGLNVRFTDSTRAIYSVQINTQ